MIYLLRQHPDHLDAARAEADRLGPAETWTPEKFAGARFLEACATETMRLKPVGPFLVLQALRDTVVLDTRIPAQTLVWLCMRSDTVDDGYFEHADRFDPRRWLTDLAANAQSPTRISMPFGAGPRVCPGRQPAMLEMKMALAALLGNFHVAAVRTANGKEPDELFSFTMEPSPLLMYLQERSA